jgi:carboxymethylenebutenolidase
MRAVLVLTLAHLVSAAFAANVRSVPYDSGGGYVQGTLYVPAGDGPFPAIALTHRWRGLDDWSKEQASKLADEGYVVLSLDPDPGEATKLPTFAFAYGKRLPSNSPGGNLSEAIDFLRSQSNVRKGFIGSIEDQVVSVRTVGGYSLEDDYFLQVEVTLPGRNIAVVKYGSVFSAADRRRYDLPSLSTLDHEEKGTSPSDRILSETASQKFLKLVSIQLFPEDSQNPKGIFDYRPTAPGEGWLQTLTLLAANLKAAKTMEAVPSLMDSAATLKK